MELTLIIFAIIFSVISAIRPFSIGKIPINISTGALLSLVVLIAFQIIDREIIQQGILGNDQLKPWEIIVIFFTVAYISISVDVTGILDFLAYKIVRQAKGSGVKLFFFFYLFSCLLTVFTSNDIVILTLTPIIFYLGKHAKIQIIPLLFAEFFGANTMSMFLFIGNPTNIIVGNALGIGFLEYTKVMWLPTIVAAFANIILLFFFFQKKITKTFVLKKDSHYVVRSWFDALLSCFLLFLMLGTLTFSQELGIPIWQITTFFAFIFVGEDIFFGFYYRKKYKTLTHRLHREKQEISKLYGLPENPNEFLIAFKRVPWKILPFIVVFFILIAGVNAYGGVAWMAEIMTQVSGSLGESIASNGTLAFLLANIINNQPMTILLSNMLINEHFQVSDLAFQGSAYAIIIASNLGANFTLIGALAGLMWRKILLTKGVKISYLDFLKAGIIITPLVFILALITLFFVLSSF